MESVLAAISAGVQEKAQALEDAVYFAINRAVAQSADVVVYLDVTCVVVGFEFPVRIDAATYAATCPDWKEMG